MIRSSDVDACHERIKQTAGVIIGAPSDWEVVGERPGETIKLRTMSLCYPNGLYLEVNARDPASEWPAPPDLTPCYMIVLGAFTDRDRFLRDYQTAVMPLIERFGGEYLLVGQDLLPLETHFPGGGGAVISKWASRAAALAFWNSPEYAEVRKLREGTGQFQVVLVDS